MVKKYLFWDLETRNAGAQYGFEPPQFVRMGQYAWNDGPVTLTTSYDEILSVVREADYVVGHNIIGADLSWLFGVDSIEPLQMAMDRKVIDTFYLANLLKPAPYTYVDSKGHTYRDAAKPENAMRWLSLENLCFQFGIPGKFGSLKEIAKRFNPPKTRVADLDFSLIDLDDPEFRMYAEQDVIAVRGLWNYLKTEIHLQQYPGEYIWREMELMSATVGAMSRNGIKVNQEYAVKRIEEARQVREKIMKWLVEEFDFPTEGKQPWKSNKGKGAIILALESFGIVPEDNDSWERTASGAPSFSGETMIAITEGTEAEELGRALATLQGQRSLSQLVLDSMKEDGRVHPEISSLQRSGRWSFTKPGVTIFGERTEALKADKALFIADEGNVLAGFDYSSADARAMAALSGDHEFARRFETDEEGNDLHDGHNLTGEAIFGKDAYYGQSDKKGKPLLRPVAKMAGHAQNYNIGAYKLANTLNAASKKENLGLSFWAPAGRGAKPILHVEGALETPEMIAKFNQAFPLLKRFKDRAVDEGETNGYVTNSWGRRMMIDEGRSYTQAPALHGQSVTREMMGDAILRLIRKGEYYIRAMRAIIHDELLMEFDESRIEEDIRVVKECMEVDFDPGTRVSLVVPFPVGHGYGKTWKDASH